ncbi:hypothetical protein [Hirschia litorea]|uniref:Uncharacterized protein n=1 Tax=Hirschia litorea TaxID=1199156 RepID=A0ABW2IQ03_9PROT
MDESVKITNPIPVHLALILDATIIAAAMPVPLPIQLTSSITLSSISKRIQAFSFNEAIVHTLFNAKFNQESTELKGVSGVTYLPTFIGGNVHAENFQDTF